MGCETENGQIFSQCREACPAGIDVPRYIRHIKNGNFDKALATIREKIPFPSVCGHACIAYCELKCARIQYDEAVAIRMLKRSACEHGVWVEEERNVAPTGKKIAIVGSGPGGLTAAYYLALKGHEITVFEVLSKLGGMLRYGIPEYRLPNNVLDVEISLIARQGVIFKTDTCIEQPADLLREGFDAALVASGAWKIQKMGIEGEKLPHVLDGIPFLKDANTGIPPRTGKKVIVVGGGNTAVDAARVSTRLGSDVSLFYRRTRAEMPANSEEIREAIDEGIDIRFLTTPIKVTGSGIECIKMKLGEMDASGRPRPEPIEGSEFIVECDTIIMAIGQSADAGSLGLPANKNGTICVDDDSLAVKKGVFAAGDVVTGPSSIIEAIAQGRKASISIDMYLGGDGVIDVVKRFSDDADITDIKERGTNRPAVHREAGNLSGFSLAEDGYSRETAISEASRCLSCDLYNYDIEINSALCKECRYCEEVCTLSVFQKSEAFNSGGYHPMVAKMAYRCMGCLNCMYVCPDFAIQIKGKQGVSSLQKE